MCPIHAVASLLQAKSASTKTAPPHPATADLCVGDADSEGGRDTAAVMLADTALPPDLILAAAISQFKAHPFVPWGHNAIQYIGKEGTFRRVCLAPKFLNVARCFMSHAFPTITPGSRLLTLQVRVPKQAVAAAVAAGAVQQPPSSDTSSEVPDWPAMEVVGSVEQVTLACYSGGCKLMGFGGILRPFVAWRVMLMSKVRFFDIMLTQECPSM